MILLLVALLGGPAVAAPADRLLAGEGLDVGQSIVSPGGAYRLIVQNDGNVVLYGPAGARWASRTGTAGTVLRMQADGNLVAYAPGPRAVWDSGTAGTGATRLVAQDDGNLVLYRADATAVWATGADVTDTLPAGATLLPGAALVAAGGGYRLPVQGDGNVVLYGPYGATWASGTGTAGTWLTMQTDGNLVAYAPGPRAVWSSGTAGSGAARALLQADGNLVLYRAGGTPVWASGTGALPLRLRGQDVTVLPTTRAVVALTFDAGANAAGLGSILATLAARGVPATFFLTGQWAVANPAGVQAVVAGGHRVGNHSMTHPDLTTLPDAAVREQVLDAQRVIRAAGADPAPLFRFPFGARTDHTVAVVNGAGQVPVRWTVDTLGWKGTSGGVTRDQVVDRVVGALRPGEIVLMHVGSNPDDGTTLDADALPVVLDRLQAAGYGFVTLEALLR